MSLRPANIIKIGEACKILGVHPNTLRKWEKEGKVMPLSRTMGSGTRYYDKSKLEQLLNADSSQYLTLKEIEAQIPGGFQGMAVETLLGEPRYDVRALDLEWLENEIISMRG